jgi:hypothetical protein
VRVPPKTYHAILGYHNSEPCLMLVTKAPEKQAPQDYSKQKLVKRPKKASPEP